MAFHVRSPKPIVPKGSVVDPPTQQNDAVNRLISKLLQLQKGSSTAVERLWNDETPIKFLSQNYETSNGSESVEEIHPEDTLGFFLLLASQTLERLSLNPSNNAISMAWLAFSVVPLSIPTQSEFLSTKVARHVAGRALLASTLAANRALLQLTVDTKCKKSKQKSTAMAILAAILVLDQVAGLSLEAEEFPVTSTRGGPIKQVSKIWKITRAALELHAEQYWFAVEQNERSSSEIWDAKMEACWLRICGVGHDEKPSSQAASINDLFAEAIGQYFLITDQCNTSRRWIPMALTIDGEPRWLETNLALLSGPWRDHWSCFIDPDLEGIKTPVEASISPSASRKRKVEQSSEICKAFEMSGSVVSIVLISRLLRILRDVNKSVDRKFNSHLGIYINTCWSHHNTEKREDPRDLGAMLLYSILDLHRRCLQDRGLAIVNDDDTIESKDALRSYYPFIHDILEQLSLSISSSPTLLLSYESQNQVRHRLEGLAVAFIFKHYQESQVVDTRLVQYALMHSVRALSQTPSSHDNGSWLSKKTNTRPLSVPSLSAKIKIPRKGSKTRSTFAGIFPGDYGPSHRGDAKIALILRAVSSSTSWDTRCSVFLSLLLNLVASLYDTSSLEYPPNCMLKSGVLDTTDSGLHYSLPRKERSMKRLKVDTEQSKHEVTVQSSPLGRLSDTRAVTCSNALDTLALCLRFHHHQQNLSQLQKLFRPSMNSDHVQEIIRLETGLRSVVSNPEIDPVSDESDKLGSLSAFTAAQKIIW